MSSTYDREVRYALIDTDGQQFITVFVEGEPVLVADDSHPNFTRIVTEARAGNAAVTDLFDVSRTVAQKFEGLTERVSVANGRVYFDGDEVHGSIANHIVRFLDAGVLDWVPLVRFLENIQVNPDEHSRTQLYDWLHARDFTITHDGLIVGYKGVHRQGDGTYLSGFTGSAIVDGRVVQGRIPNAVGSTVAMPRSEVAHDPGESCSTGLHVGTFEYAQGFAQGGMLRVHVNPRDVVSVPTDAEGEKVRVCRYTVEEVIDRPITAPVLYVPGDESGIDDDFAETVAEYDDDLTGLAGREDY